jgi:hypothetical protein
MWWCLRRDDDHFLIRSALLITQNHSVIRRCIAYTSDKASLNKQYCASATVRSVAFKPRGKIMVHGTLVTKMIRIINFRGSFCVKVASQSVTIPFCVTVATRRSCKEQGLSCEADILYGIRKFTSVFARARHRYPSWATLTYPVSWWSILKLAHISVSLFFLLLPLWSLGHPWNALFHFSVRILRQSIGLLGQGISPSQDRYLHKHRINTDIHALSGIRTHDPSFRASENSSCLRPRGQCDRHMLVII